ncbi:sigma-F transcribed protein CsfB [Bacillus megaterium]|nr:sigma-F transcribed protein CsfB [Priestia megaterium]
MEKQIKTCSVCHEQHTKGIEVFSSFICQHCEVEIVEVDSSHFRYQLLVDQLKRISGAFFLLKALFYKGFFIWFKKII